MSNNNLKLLHSNLEQYKALSNQLSILGKKETEEIENQSRLREMVKQAEQKYEGCLKANLTGVAGDQELEKAKAELKKLNESYDESKQRLGLIQQMRGNLNNEAGDLRGDVRLYRGLVCLNMARESQAEMEGNKKLNEKMIAGYAAFLSATGEPDRSWRRFIYDCFPEPSERDINLAVEKFKASNDFMSD